MSSNLKKKLAGYSALSSAFLLAGAQDAEAQIVHVDLPDDPNVEVINSFTFPSSFSSSSYYGSSYSSRFINIDVDGNMVTTGSSANPNAEIVFQVNAGAGFWASYYSTSGYSSPDIVQSRPSYANLWNFADVDVYSSSQFIGGSDYVDNLPVGYIVNGFPEANYNTLASVSYGYYTFNSNSPVRRPPTTNSYGNFVSGFPPSNDVTGYVGVKFQLAGQQHNGWVRLRIEQSIDPVSPGASVMSSSKLTILEYAYDATANAPIPVGAVGAAPIPTMGQWGLIVLNLFLMIFGVSAVRNRKGLSLVKKKAE